MPAVIYIIAIFLASAGVFLIVSAVYNEHLERDQRSRCSASLADQAEAWLRRQ